MKNTFYASIPDPPQNISLKALLGFKYFFDFGWAAIHTDCDIWICQDVSTILDHCDVFPDSDSFIAWIEDTVDDNVNCDPVEFFRLFVSVPELVDDCVAEAMMELLE